VLETTADDEQRLFVEECRLRELFQLLVLLEHLGDLLGQGLEVLDDLDTAVHERDLVFAQEERKEGQDDELRGVGLGGRNTDLRADVEVAATRGLARDGRANRIGDANGERTTRVAVAQGQKGVGGLARLAHKDANVVTEDWGLAIEEV